MSDVEEAIHMAIMVSGCKYLLDGHHLNSNTTLSAINSMFAAAACHHLPIEPNATKHPKDWSPCEWLYFFQSMVTMSRDVYDD